jgi:hypothetical protein
MLWFTKRVPEISSSQVAETELNLESGHLFVAEHV